MKKPIENLQFAPVKVTRAAVVEAASKYIGMPYTRSASWVGRVGDEHLYNADGQLIGRTNCFALLLMVAIDVRWLPRDFDINLSPENFGGREPAKTLIEILHLNCTEIEVAAMRGGDVVLMQYKDINPKNNEPHHVALCVGANSFIHANEATGKVSEMSLDPLFATRITSAWRLKNVVD